MIGIPTRALSEKQDPKGVGSKFFLSGVHCNQSKVPDIPDTMFTRPMMSQTRERDHPSANFSNVTAKPVLERDVTVMAIVEPIWSLKAN